MKPVRALAAGVVVFLTLIVLFGTGMRQAPAPEGPAGDAIAILRDPARSLEERLRAALALRRLGPEAKSVEPVLLQLLQSGTDLGVNPSDPLLKQLFGGEAGPAPPDYLLRANVAMVLGSFVPEPGSIPALSALLRDGNPLVQFHAAYALSSLGAEARPAVPALIDLLRSDDHDDTEIATFVLARIAPDPGIEPAVPVLIETLRGGKGWIASFHAAVALLKLGREEEKARAIVRDEVHLALMLPLLNDEQPMNRLHVCEALMLSGPPRRDYLDLLRKTATEDPDARVREAALEALRKVGAGMPEP